MLPTDPGNALQHLEHPNLAPCPRKPKAFLPAGISHEPHNNAHLTNLLVDYPQATIFKPFRNLSKSSTSGLMYEFISCDASCGPGKIPTNNKFYLLKQTFLGKFVITKQIAPT